MHIIIKIVIGIFASLGILAVIGISINSLLPNYSNEGEKTTTVFFNQTTSPKCAEGMVASGNGCIVPPPSSIQGKLEQIQRRTQNETGSINYTFPPLKIPPKITPTCQEGFKQLPDGSCLLDKPLNAPKMPTLDEAVTNSNPQPLIKIPELEQNIHLLINQERNQQGLSSLLFDVKLASIARAHSQDMAIRNFFDHVNPDGQDPTARGLQVGYSCHKDLGGGYYTEGIAENIFQNNLYNSAEYSTGQYSNVYSNAHYDWNDMNALAQSTVDGWMNSAGHRENILTATYDREGIGITIANDSKVYITEDFC